MEYTHTLMNHDMICIYSRDRCLSPSNPTRVAVCASPSMSGCPAVLATFPKTSIQGCGCTAGCPTPAGSAHCCTWTGLSGRTWPTTLQNSGRRCDWECAVYVDGQLLGSHRGAYDPVTLELPRQAEWQVVIRVWEPTDSGCVGLQSSERG